MPGGDRTGPFGEGSMTGRRMGYCTGNDHPGFTRLRSFRGGRFGRGFGRGFGQGRGFGPGSAYRSGYFYPDVAPDVSEKTIIENEIRILKDQLSYLEEQLLKKGEE